MAAAPERILLELGQFVSAAACERLPAAIVEKAKACLLYGLAVGIASVHASQPRQAAAAIDGELSSASGGATRLIDQRRLDFHSAAFCNAVLFHSRVQDDSHPCGHFGVVAIPAALACAERFEATGSDMLGALIAGYEVALRIGRDHAADLSARGFRTTPVYGVFASAACAARIARLSSHACARALALATSAAGGLRQWADAGTEEGAFQVGFATRNGLLCASLAAAGVITALNSLSGSAGFYRAFGSVSDRYERRVCDALGEQFEMATVTYKPYPVNQFLSGVVRGMIDLRVRAKNREPTAIIIHLHPFEADFIGMRYAGPFTGSSQTLTSAPFCAALAWQTTNVTLAGLHDLTNETVLTLARKVDVLADSSRARYSPRLVVTLDDMTVLEWQATQGASSYRLTWDAAMQMNVELGAEAGIAEDKTQALAEAVAEVDRANNVRALLTAAVECAAEARDKSWRREGRAN